MKDIVPELLKRLKETYELEIDRNAKLKELESKIIKGTITYADANEYAKVHGDIVAKVFSGISSADLPDGKMYYNIAKRTIEPVMQETYEKIANMGVATQTVLNQNAHIGIKAIKPELNQDRIDGILNRVSTEDVFDDIKWILNEPVKVFAISIIDDAVNRNADFHYRAGMDPRIIRKATGKCCKWCREVAGTYVYPDVPKDVFRRHDNCRCVVEYFPGEGKKQNVHTKKWKNEVPEDILKLRQTVGIPKQEFHPLQPSKVVDMMRKESDEWIVKLTDKEKYAIRKYSFNAGDTNDTKFFKRLNAMLRGDIPEDVKLREYAEIISGALRKNTLKNDVKCYRSLPVNPLKGYTEGDLFRWNQFVSTSVTRKGALEGKCKMVIYVHRGTNAGYIENLSEFPSQRELLLDKDCIFRVILNKDNKIELEVL